MITFVKLLEIEEDSLFALSVETKKNIKEISKDIQTINSILRDNKYPEISVSNNKYKLPKQLLKNKKNLYELFHVNQVFFTPNIRVIILYLYTYSKKGFLSNDHFQDILHVSRNTVLNDINKLRDELDGYNIDFIYSRAKGYHLVAEEYDIHRYLFTKLSILLQDPIGEWTIEYILNDFLNEKVLIPEFLTIVRKFEFNNEVQSIQDRLVIVLNLIQFILIRYKEENKIIDYNKKLFIDEHTIFEDLAKSLYKLNSTNLNEMSEINASFIELLLLGCYEKRLDHEKDEILFYKLADEIVSEMEKLSLIKFDKREDMVIGIKKHLVPAYYRLKLGFEETSEYLDVVIEHYKDLFVIVKKALQPLQRFFIREIPNSEVAYFVIHFGGYLGDLAEEIGKVKALVVCPNGISSSLILKEQLSQLFPNISFLNTHRLNEIGERKSESYDIIFSTVNIETELPFFLVPVNLDAETKKELYTLVYDEVPVLTLNPSPVDKIINATKKYSSNIDESSLRIELTEILYDNNNIKGDSPLLHELITKKSFQHTTEKLNWKEAISKAAEPLLNRDYINEHYIRRMIENVEQYGPFINLGKGIAIPHARPEDGVNKLGMSMLVLDDPIYLPEDNRAISILIVIAAIDNETHLAALSHLTNILTDDESVEKLTNAKKYSDIDHIIQQGGEE